MIVDTHLHLIDGQALRYPWLADAPALDRDWGHAEYSREARRAGIGAAFHMEVDVHDADIDAETAHIGEEAARPGSLIQGLIVSCRPEAPDFAATLERARHNKLVKGFRRVLHVAPDALSQSAIFRENIRRLAGTGLTFDLVLRDAQLPLAMALADAAPDTVFVLDHCGNPGLRGGSLGPWRAAIADLARRPNVTAKISGLVNNADPESWTAETLRPVVEHVIGCFGWDRVVWGSDWPVCTLGGGLLAWVAATHAVLSGASADERGRLLSANARRLWRLE